MKLIIPMLFTSVVFASYALGAPKWIDQTSGASNGTILPESLVEKINKELSPPDDAPIFKPSPKVGSPSIVINVINDKVRENQLLVFGDHVVWNGKIFENSKVVKIITEFRNSKKKK